MEDSFMKKKKFKISTLLILLIAIFSAIITTSCQSQQQYSASENILKVHFIDVGQADSIFIELPNSETMLIDAGNNGDGALICDYITNLGYTSLTYIIGTHPHEDHIGGMDTVIDKFSVQSIYLPKATTTTKTFEDVLNAMKSKNLKVNTAKANVELIKTDNLSINLLAPNSNEYESLNNYSAVVKITYGNNSFLFTGDAEKLSEKEITTNLKADVLKVGHHGSDTSTSQEFLKSVSPKYAVISVGKDNKYGHPNESTLTTLQTAGVQTFRTDELGTIIITSDGNTISIDKDTNSSVSTTETPTITKPIEIKTEIVYVTKTGKKYHLENCSTLNKNKISISLDEAKKGYEPCNKCNPPS